MQNNARFHGRARTNNISTLWASPKHLARLPPISINKRYKDELSSLTSHKAHTVQSHLLEIILIWNYY